MALLSFGGDAAAQEKEISQLPKSKIQSSHDALAGTSTLLSNEVASNEIVQVPTNDKKRKHSDRDVKVDSDEEDFDSKMRQKALEKQKITAAKASSKEYIQQLMVGLFKIRSKSCKGKLNKLGLLNQLRRLKLKLKREVSLE